MTGVGAKVSIDGGCSPIVVPSVVVVAGPSLIVTVFVGTRPLDGAAAGSDADPFALVTVGDEGCDASDDGEYSFELSTDPDDDVGAAAGELWSVAMMVPPYFPAS
jgi:hypothetical protein